jgi:hypothetical protein
MLLRAKSATTREDFVKNILTLWSGGIGIGIRIRSVQGNQWDPPQVIGIERVTGVVLVKTVGLIKERMASAKRVTDSNEEELKRS